MPSFRRTNRLRIPALGAWLCSIASVAVVDLAAHPARTAPREPSELAEGERSHLVSPGNTLGSIARSYRVSVDAIRDANGLGPAEPIRLGQRLVIPGAATTRARAEVSGASKNGSYAQTPEHPGVVVLTRGADRVRVRVKDRHGRFSVKALDEFTKMLRFPTGQTHAIDARLVTLVSMVSDHFGGRELGVVSGFRPYSPHQYTAHSNHNAGKAMDFVVRGVPNEVLRDYCRTFRNVGVGYYPNSSFVHLDVRATSAFWIDYAGPGQPPRYHRPDSQGDADEGAGEVESEQPDPVAPAAGLSALGATAATPSASDAGASVPAAAVAPPMPGTAPTGTALAPVPVARPTGDAGR